MSRRLYFVVPGPLDTPTGGYGYDRRIIEGLRRYGWRVEVSRLNAGFPFPSAAARADARDAFRAFPDGSTVIVDGLAFGALPELAAVVGSRLDVIPLVHHPLADETGLDREVAAALADSERRALQHAARVLVTSPATASTLTHRYGVAERRILVVEPGTDPAPVAAGGSGGRIQLLTVANIIPRKGYDVLLAALARLPEQLRASWALTCVGGLHHDPGLVASLREQIAASQLDAQVRFAGEMEGPPLADAYHAADVFVLATRYEGYGMVIAEALARGLPIVSTRSGGIPALVGPDAGLLAEPGDVHGFSAALAAIIGDAAMRQRLAAGARRRRDTLPTWDEQTAKFSAALERVGDAPVNERMHE